MRADGSSQQPTFQPVMKQLHVSGALNCGLEDECCFESTEKTWNYETFAGGDFFS